MRRFFCTPAAITQMGIAAPEREAACFNFRSQLHAFLAVNPTGASSATLTNGVVVRSTIRRFSANDR